MSRGDTCRRSIRRTSAGPRLGWDSSPTVPWEACPPSCPIQCGDGPLNHSLFQPQVPAVVALDLLQASACAPPAETIDPSALDGHWVLEGDSGPMALEVKGAGTATMTGSIVGAVGGRLQPFLEASISNGRLRFRVEREFDRGARVGSTTLAWFDDARLVGETTREDREEKRSWTARRPDVVSDSDDGNWVEQEPVVLFDGTVVRGRAGGFGRLAGRTRNPA